MATLSPLRYPGGKYKLREYTQNLITTNNLTGCTYIEPFAGGAGLALSLLDDQLVSRLVLNDIDRSIYAFWHSVLYFTDDLCQRITDTSINMDIWYEQKAVQENKEHADLLDLGFSTFFLNRVNRSGILTGGVIGGYNQTGNYLMDCRFNKGDLINKIQKIAMYRENVNFYNLDAIDFIHNIVANITEQAFVFLDPPYYQKGPRLYYNHYSHEDHIQLSREIIDNIKHAYIVTYDNVDVIKDMYSPYCAVEEFDLSYSAQRKCKGKEVRFLSPNLKAI